MERDVAVVRACASCGAARTGPYCGACGQRALDGRHTLRGMVAGFLGRVMALERGLPHTVYGLTVRPGTVIREYLAGRTAVYTHPVGYLLVAFAVVTISAALVSWLTGVSGSLGENNRLFTALAIPLVAGASRLLFWRTRLNYAEHLIAVVYLFSHAILYIAVLFVLASLVGGDAATLLAAGALAVAVAYYGWAFSRIFPSRPWLAAMGALAALAAGGAAWLGLLMLLLNMLRNQA